MLLLFLSGEKGAVAWFDLVCVVQLIDGGIHTKPMIRLENIHWCIVVLNRILVQITKMLLSC